MKELKITIEAKTDRAENFIMDLAGLVENYGIEAEVGPDMMVMINIEPLIDITLNTASTKRKQKTEKIKKDKVIKPATKKHGRTPEPKRLIDIKKFKEAVDKLGGDNFSQNIVKAMDISGLSKSSITRVYYCKDEYKPASGLLLDGCERLYKHVFGKEGSVIAGNTIDPESEKKNWIMIVRVRNSKKTTDTDVIADTIMNNNNIRRNTTFASREEIIDMINKRKQWLEA